MEIDLTKARPDVPAEIVQHFSKDVDELQEAPEEIAMELCDVREKLKELEAREKKLAAYFKSKKDRGLFNLGKCVLEVKEEKGRLTVDWKGYIKAEIGEDAVGEAERAYGKTGDPIIKVSVKRMSQAT